MGDGEEGKREREERKVESDFFWWMSKTQPDTFAPEREGNENEGCRVEELYRRLRVLNLTRGREKVSGTEGERFMKE